MIRVPDSARRDIVQVCARLYERRLVAGADGNVSIRISKQHLLATPTGMSKGAVTADDLVVCDLEGQQLQGTRRLTTEIKIHLAAYRARQDVCAVVHAHPPYATAFAVAGQVPSEQLMPEAYIAVGKVALAPYGTPSTDELANTLATAVQDHDAVLLANHGAMTLGRDVLAAYHRMEALEQLCHITCITRQLGNANLLDAAAMAKLDAIRGVYGSGSGPGEPCWHCGQPPRLRSEVRGAAWVDEPPAERPAAYVAPDVHWPGNPPVWHSGDGAAPETERIRDLARRALRELREESRRTTSD